MSEIPVTAVFFKAINDRNADQLRNCLTPDCEVHNPFGTPPYRGHDKAASILADLTRAWRTLKVIPKCAYRSANRVAIMWMAEGVGASGRAVEFDGVNVFELDEHGKITRLEGYWDARAALKESLAD